MAISYGEPLDSILLKAGRARTHILDLESAYQTFMSTKPRPYTVTFKTDPDTQDRLYSLSKISPIPRRFSLFIGDALNNLRSCLDHSAYAMVKIARLNNVKERDINFPICSSSTKYEDAFKKIKKGLRLEAIKAIDDIQPYIGGAGEYLCHLAGLNNFDKHRLLPTIWGSCEARSMLPSDRKWIADFQGKHPTEFIGASMVHRVSPLKVGDVLLRVPHAEVEENMQFILNIAFAEPEIVKGNSVIETLHQMHKMVLDIVFNFWKLGLFR